MYELFEVNDKQEQTVLAYGDQSKLQEIVERLNRLARAEVEHVAYFVRQKR